MELATIKNIWEKETLFPSITLKKKSLSFLLKHSHYQKTILDKIRQKEIITISIFAILLTGFLFLLIKSKTSVVFSDFECIQPIAISWIIIFGLYSFWELFKYFYLKQINISNMGILVIFSKITRYRQFIFAEYIISSLVSTVGLCLTLYFIIQDEYLLYEYENFSNLVLFMHQFVVFAYILITVTYSSYRLSFFRDVKNLKENLVQIKEYKEF